MKPLIFATSMVAAVILGALAIATIGLRIASASAPSGLPASVIVATTTSVGPQNAVRLFTSNGYCAARTISTGAQAIRVVFADQTNGDLSSTTVSSAVGHWQAASTTVIYDGGLTGCGSWWAVGQNASTTLTITETL